ncbi:MAG: HU family DNA-binding protein [Myxococcota bacterium]
MTKMELIEAVMKNQDGNLTKKAATELVDAVFDVVAKTVKKEKKFTYPGFGTFSLRERKARTGRNPQTGATIQIKKSKTIGFRPAKSLKDTL